MFLYLESLEEVQTFWIDLSILSKWTSPSFLILSHIFYSLCMYFMCLFSSLELTYFISVPLSLIIFFLSPLFNGGVCKDGPPTGLFIGSTNSDKYINCQIIRKLFKIQENAFLLIHFDDNLDAEILITMHNNNHKVSQVCFYYLM